MKSQTSKCSVCGFTVLTRELDELGNGPCCPSSTRKTRSDKGTHKEEANALSTELVNPATQSKGGAGSLSAPVNPQSTLIF